MKQKEKIETIANEISTPSPYLTMNTWLTFEPEKPDNFEWVDEQSDTQPDMVMDLELMINRAMSGIPVPTRMDGYNSEDYPDFFKMDEFELTEYRTNLAHQMQDILEQHHVSSKILEEKEDEKRKNAVTKEQQTDEKPSDTTKKEGEK